MGYRLPSGLRRHSIYNLWPASLKQVYGKSRGTCMLRSGRQLLGAFLICVGALSLVLNFVGTWVMGGLYYQQGEELTDQFSRPEIVFPFIIGFAFLSLGFVLREGKKSTLLFLRPFNSIVDDLTMKSISGKIGASFTAVALDNGTMPSARSSLRDRAAALLLFLPAGLFLFFVASVVSPKHNYEKSLVMFLPSSILFALAVFVISRAFRCIFPFCSAENPKGKRRLKQATQPRQIERDASRGNTSHRRICCKAQNHSVVASLRD